MSSSDKVDVVVTMTTDEILSSYQRKPRRNPGSRKPPAAGPPAKFSKYVVQTALVRSAEYDGRRGPQVVNASAAVGACGWLGGMDQEHFAVLCLDGTSHVRAIHVVGIGTSDRAFVESVDIFKAAVLSGSRRIILIHNHPSGEAVPSNADIQLTDRVIEMAKCVGVALIDHIIIGYKDHCSLRDQGFAKFD